MNVYLAGPMRGLPQFNFPAFRRAAGSLRAEGHVVFSPAERDEQIGFDPTDMTGDEDLASIGFDLREALRIDTEWICRWADAVAVLDDWERSSGARAEVALARALSLPVYVAEPLAAGCRVDITTKPTPDVLERTDLATEEHRRNVSHGNPQPKREVEGVDVQHSALIEAQRLIHGARQRTYGHPADDFARTALHWQAILGTSVTARQVALCMVGVKLSRLSETPDHRDSIVDSVGYLGCYELIADREAES